MLIVCLDGSYHTGSVFYMITYASSTDNVKLMCPYITNQEFALQYNIQQWNPNVIQKHDTLIINSMYMLFVLDDIPTYITNIILFHHDHYRTISSIYSELIKRLHKNITVLQIHNWLSRCRVILVHPNELFPKAPILESTILSYHKQPHKDYTKTVIINVGTLCPRKNQLSLLKFLHNNPDVFDEAYFIGVEEYHPHKYYKDYVLQCLSYQTSNIHLIKSCDPTPYYQKGTVFIFVSLSEESPIVILEALSHGLPVLTTNVGNASSLVKHGINGFFFSHCNELTFCLSQRNTLNVNKHDIQHRLLPSMKNRWKELIYNPIIVLIDMDNTICDYSTAIMELTNVFDPFSKKSYDHPDGFYLSLQPYPNAIQVIANWDRNPNVIIRFLSHSENEKTDQEKRDWLDKWFGDGWGTRLQTVRNSHDKIYHKGTILIDDSPDLPISPHWLQVYYSQPYNKGKTPYFTWNNDIILNIEYDDIIGRIKYG